ncbi:MAG: hypothetical protein OHK0046_24540 [Anaerolineae bacterium]
MLATAARLIALFAGLWIVIYTILSAVRTFVLPRAVRVRLTVEVFRFSNKILRVWSKLRGLHTFEDREPIQALLSPVALLTLPVMWLALIAFGYTLIFWGASGHMSWRDAFVLSGSSLMTLGFKFVDELPLIILAFTEAMLGMMLIALLIGYLPTMYSAFSRREAAVNKLEVRAGSPPSAVEMVIRLHSIGVLEDFEEMRSTWQSWEDWFTELEESHTTLGPLSFFRSPKPQNSWITTAGTVLDCAALVASTVNLPRTAVAGLTIRAGYIALRSISDFFVIEYDPDPSPDNPISITREEFNTAYDQMAAAGVPIYDDCDYCWTHFKGWRVNYDTTLLSLAAFIVAPYALWTSDRQPVDYRQRETLPITETVLS